jgi:hypothetical protein
MIARALTVCAGFVLCSSTALAQQADALPRQPERGRGIVTATRFATTLSLPAERGPAGSLSVSLGKLSLSGGRRIEVPPMGFYVATLVTGDVVTNIGGQEVSRHTGDSWSVDTGEMMVVQLQGRSESALLEVFTVKVVSP